MVCHCLWRFTYYFTALPRRQSRTGPARACCFSSSLTFPPVPSIAHPYLHFFFLLIYCAYGSHRRSTFHLIQYIGALLDYSIPYRIMSSAILPYPSQPSYPLSRPSTPRPTTTLSAPPTPITPTHLLPVAMERARSTEGVVNGVEQALNQARGIKDNKEPKPGRLKFEWEHIERPKTPESDHGIDDDEEQKMDVDEEQPIQPPYLGTMRNPRRLLYGECRNGDVKQKGRKLRKV